jgi:vacuolar-type H+-ATPase subunit C/Vma6
MEKNQVKLSDSDYRKRLRKLEKDNEKLEAALMEREAMMANLFSFVEGKMKEA